MIGRSTDDSELIIEQLTKVGGFDVVPKNVKIKEKWDLANLFTNGKALF